MSPSPPASHPSGSSGSSAILSLKTKGNKPFGVFSKLSDETSLTSTWKTVNKVASHLDHGHRIENLSWRLWHLRDIMVPGGGGEGGAGRESEKEERRFNSISDSVGQQLEAERKRDIVELDAPVFRWTDRNDAVRHLGVMRIQRRESQKAAERESLMSSEKKRDTSGIMADKMQQDSKERNLTKVETGRDKSYDAQTEKNKVPARLTILDGNEAESEVRGVKDANRKSKQQRKMSSDRDHHSSEDSGTSESGSTSASYLRLKRRRQQEKQQKVNSSSTVRGKTSKSASLSTSPPVCWRLTKAEENRRRKLSSHKDAVAAAAVTTATGASQAETSKAGASETRASDSTTSTPLPIVSSTWSLDEIEAAEKELEEQGVELSGPFLAMLADLKRGELTKVKTEDVPVFWSHEPQYDTTAVQPLQPLQQQQQQQQQQQLPQQPLQEQQQQQHQQQRAYMPTSNMQSNHFPTAHQQHQHQQHHHMTPVNTLNLAATPFNFASPVISTPQTSQMSPIGTPHSMFQVMSLPASPAGPPMMSTNYSSPHQGQNFGFPQHSQPPQQSYTNQMLHHRRRSSLLSGKQSEPSQPRQQQQQQEPEKVDVRGESSQTMKVEEDGKELQKPQCVNCGATSTPLWRRDANFELQCNACGLYLKLHKVPRPKTLKQRRGEKKGRDASPSLSDGKEGKSTSMNSPKGSGSANGSSKDEWLGIHAGSSCANCGTSTTPLWRKDPDGRIICNACGLYYKLHNAHRPVTMRMDAIKRRSRYDDRARKPSGTEVNSQDPTNVLSDSMQSLAGGVELSEVTGFEGGEGVQGSLGPLQQVRSHLLNEANLLQDTTSPIGTIHIPSDLWENQLCPMGAWGENCCQNLPQPDDELGLHQHLLHHHHHEDQSIPSNQTLNPVEATTMDAILGADWLMDYGNPGNHQGSSSSSSNNNNKSNVGVPSTSLFNPTSLQGTPEESVVGPSYPLKKRKVDSMASTNSPSDWWTFQASQPSTGGVGPTERQQQQ